jgi:TP901 family phage tail tape measure protein
MMLVGGATIRAAANFEQGMANMSAVLRPTQEEFKSLRDLAVDMAQTTKFTASEAADGMEMLARNGIDTANILGGAAKATLDLASAAGASLPSAADAMTDVMVTFRKTGSDLDDVVNNIAGTLVNSKMGWEDYVGALGQAAGAAGSLGMSFSDMNAVLAATAPAFKSGVEAGTSLKGFLLRLAPSSKQAKEIIKSLNLEFFNSQGLMKSAAEISEELRQKVGGLTKQAQAEVLGALFGQRTIRTALRMMEEGAEGIERFRARIAEGDAEEMSKRRLDTLLGSWNLFRAAVESAAIAIGDSGILAGARTLVDAAAEAARNIATLNPELLRWATIMAGIAVAAGPAILAAGLFAAAIGAISLPVAATIAAVAAVVGTLTAFWGEIEIAARMVSNAAAGIYNSVKTWLVDKFGWIADGIQAVIDHIVNMFKWLADKLGLTAVAKALENEVSATAKRLGNDFKMVGDLGSQAADTVTDAWRRASKEIEEERKTFEGWSKALGHWSAMQGQVMESEARRAMGAWSKMAAEMNSNALQATLRRPSDEINLGTYGTGTFDASQFEDAERIIDQLEKMGQNDGVLDMAREGFRIFEATRTPAEALQAEFARLNQLVQAGAIGFDTYTRAVERAQNEFTGLNQVAEGVSRSLGSAFEDMVIDGQNWRDSLSGFLRDVARELLRVAAITPLMNAIKGGITSNFGAGGGGLAALLGFQTGGSFKVGGTGGTDSQVVAFRASPGEMVDVRRPGQGGRGGVLLNMPVSIDATGADAAELARVRAELTKLQTNLPGIVTQSVRKAQNSNVKLW